MLRITLVLFNQIINLSPYASILPVDKICLGEVSEEIHEDSGNRAPSHWASNMDPAFEYMLLREICFQNSPG